MTDPFALLEDAPYVDDELYDDVLAFFRANADWAGRRSTAPPRRRRR